MASSLESRFGCQDIVRLIRFRFNFCLEICSFGPNPRITRASASSPTSFSVNGISKLLFRNSLYLLSHRQMRLCICLNVHIPNQTVFQVKNPEILGVFGFCGGGAIRTLGGCPHTRLLPYMAERARFELAMPCGILAFQASALDHYATSPPQTGLRFVAKNS